MKPNVLVALLVGLVLGLMIGRFASGPGKDAAAPGGSAPTAAAAPSAPPADTTVYKVPVEGSPVAGQADALVTLVEFTDYQCPFCGRANATVKQLQEDYGSKLRVVMKQNPLSFHPNARPAALAALAAGEQGKYWQMHEKLFANQKALEAANLESYAQELGLDVARWKRDMQDAKFAALIQRDQALALQLGASGTPAFFINGRLLSGAQPVARFKAIIDEELQRAEQLVRSGVAARDVYARLTDKGLTAAAARPQAAAPAPTFHKIDVPADAPSFGPATAKVTIVEWSDFQCPFCSRVAPTLKQIKQEYGQNVRVVFRHQPLSFHPFAKGAAEASMAAHEQGKFWEFHDALFADQKALGREDLEKTAAKLGLNVARFKAALDSGKFRAKVEADAQAGAAVGANGTPTFFINGRQFVGAQPFAAFKTVIDEEIAKADKLLAQGVKPGELYAKLLEQGAAQAPAAPAPQAAPAEPPVQNIQLGQAPVKGPKNAPVTIVAYSDFECPFCSRVVPTLAQVEKEYGGKVKVAFKNLPLPFHPNAKLAAEAALAAHEQGKFWQMHDKLFANQRALGRADLERYAQELGLNVAQFKAALDSGKFTRQVEADAAEAARVGANGTPTFYINGKQLVGAVPYEQFKQRIDEALSAKVARDVK